MNQALIKHFKLSESDVAQMQAALQPHQTVLEVLLEKNLIDPAAYLAWAKEHYSLPVLKIEFLNKNNNVESLLGRYKNVFPKNIVPFHEMDGVLYVMCLEPTPFEAPQTIQYVLAPFDVVQKYSHKNETSIVHQEAVVVPKEYENTNPLFKNLEATKGNTPLESFSFDNISIGETKTEEPPPGSKDPGEIKLEDKADVPAGLNFPSSPNGSDNLIISENPVTSVDLNSFKFEGLTPVVDTSAAAPQAAPAPEKVAPAKIAVMSAESLIATHPPKNKPVETPAPSPVVPAQATMTPIATQKSEFDEVLQALKKYFDQSMVLLFSNGNLEAKAWDQSWTKAPHSQNMIDVSTPSIFRIVNESQNPYHGHVVPNPVNESFFNTWNKGQYPEHITICPIVHNKKIYGMVLGSTSKEGAKKYQLHHIQEIADSTLTLIISAQAA